MQYFEKHKAHWRNIKLCAFQSEGLGVTSDNPWSRMTTKEHSLYRHVVSVPITWAETQPHFSLLDGVQLITLQPGNPNL